MGRKKVIELYGRFEEWIGAHKYSSSSISRALKGSMADPENRPTEGLKSYISRLKEMRSEINSEIRETKDWIAYLERRER